MQTDLSKANTALFLDGTRVPRANYTYNRDTDRMRYAPETDLRPGNHTVKVVASDPEGLLKRKTWSFDLARP